MRALEIDLVALVIRAARVGSPLLADQKRTVFNQHAVLCTVARSLASSVQARVHLMQIRHHHRPPCRNESRNAARARLAENTTESDLCLAYYVAKATAGTLAYATYTRMLVSIAFEQTLHTPFVCDRFDRASQQK